MRGCALNAVDIDSLRAVGATIALTALGAVLVANNPPLASDLEQLAIRVVLDLLL